MPGPARPSLTTPTRLLQGNDLLGEMIISRLPVNNPREAQTVVNKTLNYRYPRFRRTAPTAPCGLPTDPTTTPRANGTQFHMASDETIAELAPGFSASVSITATRA